MTKLLEKAVEVVRRLPPDSQDDIARAMLSLASRDEEEPEPIDPAPRVTRAAVLRDPADPAGSASVMTAIGWAFRTKR